jgi:phosphoglycerate dehydrogenase-like enzyme
MVDADILAQMKPDSVLINIGRGALVDEPALIDALQTKRIRGAVLDVAATEPLPKDSPLWDMDNVIIFPHSASTSVQENSRLVELFCDNMARYLAGEPLVNVIDLERLY